MTHEQAAARCEQLNREEDGDRHWFAHEVGPDEWEVVSVTAPGLPHHGPLKESVASRPEPDAPDPRPSLMRNIPPWGPG